jgi:hypothetical protein
MNQIDFISQLRFQCETIAQLVSNLADDEIQWKPDPENWSIVEVLYHLVYEEIYDFRRYLGQIFGSEPSISPVKAPEDWKAQYLKASLPELLEQLQEEREKSILWIETLKDPDWGQTITFSWGSLRAGDLMAAWLAHDLLHMRQIIELRYAISEVNHAPYLVEYAGKW